MNKMFNRKSAAGLLLIFGALLAMSPAGTRKANILTPGEIASTIIGKSDHVEAEELAVWVIDKDPDLLLVDIRSSDEYNQFHIPMALNIPLVQLFTEESREILDNDQTVVLYSNGGTHAAQAWVMLKQMGIESYVLLGGLNYWSAAILNPEPPDDLVADSEILKYQFRKSASGYFNGGGTAIEQNKPSEKQSHPKPKIKFKKKKKAEEGC